jgi:GTP-binding protein
MYHCQLFRDNERLNLDNNDLERERGITITSKNVQNIIDNNNLHADFGGGRGACFKYG